jgi:hypothetical protein
MMVTEFGMSDLGPIQYEQNSGSVFLGRDYTNTQRNFSSEVAFEIDKAVREIIDTAHKQAIEILTEHKGESDAHREHLARERNHHRRREIDSLIKTGKLPENENSINVDETTKLLEQAGIQAITVHCRTTKQGYAGLADYAQIRDLGKRLSVPLIVSGDIFTPQKAKESLQITSGSMVMVARGGLGNPRLVSSIDQYFKDGTVLPNLTIQEEVTYARDFASRLVSYEGRAGRNAPTTGPDPAFFLRLSGL